MIQIKYPSKNELPQDALLLIISKVFPIHHLTLPNKFIR